MDRSRLLVVDDDPGTRRALYTLFTRQGWHVSLAATVAEGLALLELAPTCLILDLNLPDGDGIDILREVRARHPRTPVAVCSGTNDPNQLALVQALTPDLMLWKPIDTDSLLRLCERARAALV